MDREDEISRIMEAAARRLEFLEYAGVREVRPPARGQADAAAPAPVEEAAPAAKTPAAPDGPVVFRLWRLAEKVAFAEGALKDAPGGPFPEENITQLERLARWMGGELGMKFSAKKGWSREFPTMEAAVQGLKEELRAAPPVVVVALGPLAAGALMESRDIEALRGRFHDADGVLVMPTHSTSGILSDPALKKQTHEDMLMVIGRLTGC